MKKTIPVFCCLSICFLLSVFCQCAGLAPVAYANGLAVSNVTLTGQDTANETIKVQFDITWNNSWKGSINNDAAWVFVKYSTDSGSTWHHATLLTTDTADHDTNPSGYSQGTGTGIDIIVPDDNTTSAGGGYGCFIQRSTTGGGTLSVTGVQLVWDWGQDGLSATDTARIKVFGIEMVYVPEGSFYIGDGNGIDESTSAFHENGADNTAVQITTASKDITCDTNIYDDIDTTPIGVDGDNGITGNTSWPNGYPAFYIMKYEISQGQYRDFLNTLTSTQKSTRTVTMTSTKYVMTNADTVSYRNGLYTPDGSTIVCDFDDDGTGDETTDGEWIAMNYLSWMDLAAFADWAALRPMTELEFEKACRGTNSAVYGEYAWGTTDITEANTLSGSGTSTEGVTENGNGLCNYYSSSYNPNGPLRAGFAAESATNRVQAGAGYYGIMEFSGNNWERAVTIGNSTGRNFLGTNGNGELSTNGNADISDWPGYSSGEVTGASGSGFRGGSWLISALYARVSRRSDAASAHTGRSRYFGGRVCRQGF